MYGQNRKQEVQSSLSGVAAPQPVMIDGPGVGGARNAVNFQPAQGASGVDIELASQLGNYVQGELAQAVKLKQEKSMMDGQMANYQGMTMDQLETQGDKWALEGYRLVEARELASNMLLVQQQEIANTAYQDDPDAYRDRLSSRMSDVIAGAPDARTAELARQTFMEHAPSLLDSQLTQHIEYKERQNFDALQRSVHTISLDPTANDDLVAFAMGGLGSATAGLSDDRRREAVVSGVELAFSNDNPLAYAALADKGLLGENLTSDQKDRVEQARRSYENRKRGEWDAELYEATKDLMDKAVSGGFSNSINPGPEAADALADLLAEHHIEINKQEAGSIYLAAENGTYVTKSTQGALLESAEIRGDDDAQVSIITNSLISTESSGNPHAINVDPSGRVHGGLLQMGQARLIDYANATGTEPMTPRQFAALSEEEQRPINEWHVKDVIKVVKDEYGHLIGTQKDGVTITLSGLVAARHLGPVALDRWMRGDTKGEDSDYLGTSVKDYMIKHGMGDMSEYMSTDQKKQLASDLRQDAFDRLQLDKLSAISPELTDLDDNYTTRRPFHTDGSPMTRDEWLDKRNALYTEYGITKTVSDMEREIELSNSAILTANSQEEKQRAEMYQAELSTHVQRYSDVVDAYNNNEASAEDVNNAAIALHTNIGNTQGNLGISGASPSGLSSKLISQIEDINDTAKQRAEAVADIAAAEATNSVGLLPTDLQATALKEKSYNTIKHYSDKYNQLPVDEQTPEALHTYSVQAKHEVADYIVDNDIVDPALKDKINGVLSLGMADGDTVTDEAAAAVQSLLYINQRNPKLLDKYVEAENLLTARAVLYGVGTEEGSDDINNIKSSMISVNKRLSSHESHVNKEVDFSGAFKESWKHRIGIGPFTSMYRMISGDANLNTGVDESGYLTESDIYDKVAPVVEDKYRQAYTLKVMSDPTAGKLPTKVVMDQVRQEVDSRTLIMNGQVTMTPIGGPTPSELVFGTSNVPAGQVEDAIQDYITSAYKYEGAGDVVGTSSGQVRNPFDVVGTIGKATGNDDTTLVERGFDVVFGSGLLNTPESRGVNAHLDNQYTADLPMAYMFADDGASLQVYVTHADDVRMITLDRETLREIGRLYED